MLQSKRRQSILKQPRIVVDSTSPESGEDKRKSAKTGKLIREKRSRRQSFAVQPTTVVGSKLGRYVPPSSWHSIMCPNGAHTKFRCRRLVINRSHELSALAERLAAYTNVPVMPSRLMVLNEAKQSSGFIGATKLYYKLCETVFSCKSNSPSVIEIQRLHIALTRNVFTSIFFFLLLSVFLHRDRLNISLKIVCAHQAAKVES